MGQESGVGMAGVGYGDSALLGAAAHPLPPSLRQLLGSAASLQPGVPVPPHAAAAVCHRARAPVLVLTLLLIGLYVEVEEGEKKTGLCSIVRIQAILGSL